MRELHYPSDPPVGEKEPVTERKESTVPACEDIPYIRQRIEEIKQQEAPPVAEVLPFCDAWAAGLYAMPVVQIDYYIDINSGKVVTGSAWEAVTPRA